jgi:hypothetical protein
MGIKRKRLVAIVIVIIMTGAASFFYWQYTKPKSIHTIYQDLDKVKQTFRTYKPGDEVPVTGRITAIEDFNTTNGPVRIVMLDGAPRSEGIIVDPGTDCKIGDQFTATLHFKQYRYNNDSVVSAEELFGPLPFLPLELSRVIHGVSVVSSGMVLLPGNLYGHIELRVFATVFEPHGGYPLELVDLTLRKGKHFGALDVAGLTLGNGSAIIDGTVVEWDPTDYPVVDSISALNRTSANGIVEFVDAGNMGRLDGGDSFILNVSLTPDAGSYESYLLQLQVRGMFELAQYIVVGNEGPLRYITEPSFLQVKAVSDVPDANGRKLTIMVACSVGQSLFPYDRYDWELYESNSGTSSKGKLGDDSSAGNVPGKPSLRYTDVNANGLLDYPDEIVIINVAPMREYSISLTTVIYWTKNSDSSPKNGGTWQYGLRWISGLGICPSYGSYVRMNSSQTSPGTFRVNISEMYGEPGIELKMGNNGVILSQSGTEILNTTLVDGPLGGSGTTLNFTDADSNGYINEGDFFSLTGAPGESYALKLNRRGGGLSGEAELTPY